MKKKIIDSPPKLPLQTSYEPTQVNFINSTSIRKVEFKTYLLLNKGDYAKLPPVPSDHYEELNIFCYAMIWLFPKPHLSESAGRQLFTQAFENKVLVIKN